MAVVRMSLDSSQFTAKGKNKTSEVSAFTFVAQKPAISHIRPKKSIMPALLRIVVVVLIIVGAFWGINAVKSIFTGKTVLGAQSTIPVLNPKLMTDENGKTNVLLVGIDTRESGTVELNTDTIILGSYDEKTNRFAMVSFPRDLSVVYPGTSNSGRINGVYASGERKKKGSGLSALQQVVEEISGQKIQYAGMVDLKGFIDAIDVIGGVDVYLDTDLSGLYPTDQFSYVRVSFKKGWNKFDGKTALQYSRIRKEVVPASELGDFARARRQQKVIQAVVDKVSKTETLLDAKKMWNLFTVMQKNVKTTKFTIADIQAAIGILKDKGKPTTYNYVMDYYAGNKLGRLIDVISTVPYEIGPVQGEGKWSNIQAFIKEYLAEPTLPSMSKKIVVYDGGNPDFTTRYKALTDRFYFVNFVKGGTYIIPSETVIYAVGGKTYDKSAAYLAPIVLGKVQDVPNDFPVSVDNNTAMVIVL